MNQIPKESIRLLRDVDAYMVPSGDEVKLLAGNLVKVTQALGGNYTVIMNGNMVQIREENVDALGIKIPKNQNKINNGGDITQQVWDQLKTCYDPEIPVNIVELGLIYDLNVLGLWLVENYRVQFSQIVSSKGIDGLIKEIDEKNHKLMSKSNS